MLVCVSSYRVNLILYFVLFGYLIAFTYFSQLQFAQIFVALFAFILIYFNDRVPRIKTLILPLLLTSVVYDSQRLFSDYLRGSIHIIEPYDFDLLFFGINTKGVLLTPNEWCQNHLHWALDLFCGAGYILFIPEFFLFGAYLLFSSDPKSKQFASQMLWGFFWLNLIGYSTYYWYPAAPPWYYALYGRGPANLAVTANVAGCGRFDALLGIPVFKTWYGHSADVFGAIPSLHVAYPFLAAFFAFKADRLKIWGVFFFLWIAFAAVYLNHHYVLDVLCGVFYALLTGYTMIWIMV